MSTITTPPTASIPKLQVPTLDDIRELTSEPDSRVVFRDVDWAFYEQFVDSISEEAGIHVDYDGKDVEIVMGISYRHDEMKELLGRFVESVAQELAIPYKSGGQTPWMRREANRGVEADKSYFFLAEKLAMIAAARARKPGKWSEDVAGYPNPDLAAEVDVSRSKIDRPGIYAALRVAEVWRFDDERIFIDRLGADERYHDVPESQFLPLTAEEIRRWLVEEDSSDESAWARRLRAELAPRLAR